MRIVQKISVLALGLTFLACSNSDDDATPPVQKTCVDALTEVQIAQENYDNSPSTITCDIYKAKLQQQQTLCGDVGGSIQVIIDGLMCNQN